MPAERRSRALSCLLPGRAGRLSDMSRTIPLTANATSASPSGSSVILACPPAANRDELSATGLIGHRRRNHQIGDQCIEKGSFSVKRGSGMR